jgi:hypothetical protein
MSRLKTGCDIFLNQPGSDFALSAGFYQQLPIGCDWHITDKGAAASSDCLSSGANAYILPAGWQQHPPNRSNCAEFLEPVIGFHKNICKDIGASVSSEAYRIDIFWRSEQMTMIYEIVDQHILKWELDSPPSIDDYQVVMPGILEALASANISKLLIVLNFVDGKHSPQAMSLSEFAFNDLKKFIDKIACVCSSGQRVRMREILDPLQNQGKEIAFFDSIEEAEGWLNR